MKRRDFLKMGATLGVATTALPVLIGGSPVRVLGKSPLHSLLSNATGNDNILVIIHTKSNGR